MKIDPSSNTLLEHRPPTKCIMYLSYFDPVFATNVYGNILVPYFVFIYFPMTSNKYTS